MSFTSSIGGDDQPFDDARASELPGLIADVACSRLEFLVLTNDASGEYVQCAEAHERLVVELRVRVGAGWRQVRLCRPGASRERLPPQVEGYEGYETREVLDVEEAELIFADFLAGRPPSERFEAVDMGDEYASEGEGEGDDTPTPTPPESRGLFGRLKAFLGG